MHVNKFVFRSVRKSKGHGRGNFKRVIQLKSTGELKVAAYNEQFATDNTEKSQKRV